MRAFESVALGDIRTIVSARRHSGPARPGYGEATLLVAGECVPEYAGEPFISEDTVLRSASATGGHSSRAAPLGRTGTVTTPYSTSRSPPFPWKREGRVPLPSVDAIGPGRHASAPTASHRHRRGTMRPPCVCLNCESGRYHSPATTAACSSGAGDESPSSTTERLRRPGRADERPGLHDHRDLQGHLHHGLHWNSGRGAPAGTIALKDETGRTYGPWPVTVRSARAACRRPTGRRARRHHRGGTYTVIDSDPATWSFNRQSQGRGITVVKGFSSRVPLRRTRLGRGSEGAASRLLASPAGSSGRAPRRLGRPSHRGRGGAPPRTPWLPP